MLSERRRGIDNVFALRNGTLTMFLDKEAYERAGIVGKPHGVKGKRGLKPRWSEHTTPKKVLARTDEFQLSRSISRHHQWFQGRRNLTG